MPAKIYPAADVSFSEEKIVAEIGRRTIIEAKTHTAGLLERLQASIGCLYLSDLHQPDWLPLIQQVLPDINPKDYSIQEWNDAVRYITGIGSSFSNRADAVRFLQYYQSPMDKTT